MVKIRGLDEIQALLKDGNSPFVGRWSVPIQTDFNKKKDELYLSHAQTMFMRLLTMFKWNGLPEKLKAETIEKYLLQGGYAIVKDVPAQYKGGGIYCLPGNLGGLYDADLLPTECTITSTWLSYSVSGQVIGKDCVVIRNDPCYVGALPIIARYCSQLTDLDITLRMQAVNMRTSHLLFAPDDDSKKDAETFLEHIEEGELGVIGGKQFEDMLSFDSKEYGHKQTSSIKDTIEAMQWLMAHQFIEFGLNDNYNMKREAINSSETDANEDTLFTLVDLMLKYRKEGAEMLNKLYGLNVSVELADSWKRAFEDMKRHDEIEQAQIDAAKQEPEQEPQQEPKKEGEEE